MGRGEESRGVAWRRVFCGSRERLGAKLFAFVEADDGGFRATGLCAQRQELLLRRAAAFHALELRVHGIVGGIGGVESTQRNLVLRPGRFGIIGWGFNIRSRSMGELGKRLHREGSQSHSRFPHPFIISAFHT